MPRIQGTSVAPGLALGPVHVVRDRQGAVPVWTVRSEDVEAELARLEEALAVVGARLERQQQTVKEQTGEQEAGIFAVHRMVLLDPGARESAELSIRQDRINAEAAVQGLVERLRSTMGQLEGDNVRDYAADVSEPWRVVLDVLMQRDLEHIRSGVDQVILASEQLTPQVATFLDRERVLGIITETGGRFSHGAVLARSLGIPCVVGLPNLLARLEQDMPVLIDGDHGAVQLRPSAAEVDEFLERKRQRQARREVLEAHAQLPAATSDGAQLAVGVNLESTHDLDTFEVATCDGVGLLRTEFLYMERNQFPSEEEQFRLYRRVVDCMAGKPVIIRTLDIGNDKQLPYFRTPPEVNPALGWRGLRIVLEWQDLLRVQLRAMLRASAMGDLRVLLPMVSSLEEVRAVREIFDQVRGQLVEQGYEVADELRVGIMVEVPSVLWILEELIEEVDYVSVGTNDLVQYLLAVDRDNPRVAQLYDPYSPAVLRALAHVARVAGAAGKPCAVCGEIAGDFVFAQLLLGLGYTAVSVAPNFLAEVRWAVRQTTLERAQLLARDALACVTSAEVRVLLDALRGELQASLPSPSERAPEG